MTVYSLDAERLQMFTDNLTKCSKEQGESPCKYQILEYPKKYMTEKEITTVVTIISQLNIRRSTGLRFAFPFVKKTLIVLYC